MGLEGESFHGGGLMIVVDVALVPRDLCFEIELETKVESLEDREKIDVGAEG